MNTIDELLFEPLSKEYLDDNLRYVRTTEYGLIQYNDEKNNQYYLETNNEFSSYKTFYDISFIIKKNTQ